MIPFKAPEYNESSFNCPHCNAYSQQSWYETARVRYGNSTLVNNLSLALCTHCNNYSLWLGREMVYPDKSGILMPNKDLRKDIQDDYNEARAIVNKSPRGATALLRLCIQKICEQLGESGVNINADISSLVKKGLPATIQQALDIVRVVGNNAVHPGQIDLKDDVATANKLFDLVNLIARVMITQPKEIEELYGTLPKDKRIAIEQRDKTT